jgi:hypothetical protein
MIDTSEILNKITQQCDVMYSDQSINNNDFFVKNRNDTNNFEDEMELEKLNISLKTTFSEQFVFDKVGNQLSIQSKCQ